eukprot:s234_g10.t1
MPVRWRWKLPVAALMYNVHCSALLAGSWRSHVPHSRSMMDAMRKRSNTWQHGDASLDMAACDCGKGAAAGASMSGRKSFRQGTAARSLEPRRSALSDAPAIEKMVRVTVGLSAESTKSIVIDTITTVAKLRRKIQDVSGVSQRAQMLSISGKVLGSCFDHQLLSEVAPEVFYCDGVDVTVLRRCSEAQAEWLDMLERGDESARAGLFSGVARDLQELCDFNRLSRFRHVLQEHMMNDAHRYAFHRLRVHLLHERCPFTHPGVWRSEVCQWLQEDETFLLMALEINNPAAEVHTPILLYGAREQIQKKLELAKMLAENPRVDPLVLADVAPCVLHDREFLLIAARRSGAILQMAAPELQQDLELVKACVMQSGSALRFVAPELKANKDIVLRAVGNTGLALEHAAWELRDDEEVVQLAVRCTGLALEFASDRLKSLREIVMESVGQDGCAIMFAAEALKDDMDVVSRAVQVSGQALKHVSGRLRNSREVVVLAARQHAQSLQHASPELRSDLDTVIDAVSASFKAFEFASPELRAEPKVIRSAAKQLLSTHGIIVHTDAELPEAIETNVLLVSKESGQHLLAALQTGLITTRTFGLAVVRHDPQLYRRLEEHVKADKEVSLEAVKRLPDLFPDMPFQTRNQLDVQVAAVMQKPEMISFVLPTDVTRVQRAVAAVAQACGLGL